MRRSILRWRYQRTHQIDRFIIDRIIVDWLCKASKNRDWHIDSRYFAVRNSGAATEPGGPKTLPLDQPFMNCGDIERIIFCSNR